MSRTMNKRKKWPATPATQALDEQGVSYDALPYEHDAGVTAYGDEAAAALGLDASTVLKTLVVTLDTGEVVMACVPVSGKLDLKALAAACDAKKASLASEADARRLTGYVLGGVSPLGTRTRLRVVVDAQACTHEAICVSGGRRGFDVRLSPADLVRICSATTAPITAH